MHRWCSRLRHGEIRISSTLHCHSRAGARESANRWLKCHSVYARLRTSCQQPPHKPSTSESGDMSDQTSVVDEEKTSTLKRVLLGVMATSEGDPVAASAPSTQDGKPDVDALVENRLN